MSAVVFISGSTMGDALGSAGRALQNIFEQLGHEFFEVNFAEPGAPDLLDRIIRKTPIEFAFSWVGMGVDLAATTADGKQINLWEILGVPFISLNGDSPAYFLDRHIMPGSRFACLYGFPEHYRLRKRLPGIKGLIGVVPPFIVDETAKAAIDFAAKERGKLLFLKNGNDPAELLSAWRDALPNSVFIMLADLAAELASQLSSGLGNDIDALVCESFRGKGLDIEHETNLRLFFIAQLDDYLRRLKSTFIAECLLDFPVEVHGFNWDHVDFSKRRATLVPSANYGKSRTLIKGSLGLLDMSPNTEDAPHDRPMRAFGMYTLCLTNEQAYFRQHSAQYAAFSFKFEKESLQAKVADAIAHPRRCVELGINVAESFIERNRPEAFARFMLDTASSLRLACSPRFATLQNYFGWPPSKLG